jgi:lipoprotein-anchoring transpeptidase ErfK/SrfK
LASVVHANPVHAIPEEMMKRLSLALVAGTICISIVVAEPIQKQNPARRRASATQRKPTPPRISLTPEEINTVTQEIVGPESQGAAVIRAQILLARARFSPGEIELAFNQNLQSAVMAFQTAFGLQPTGIVDAETWGALESQSAAADSVVSASADGSPGAHTAEAQSPGEAVAPEVTQGLDDSAFHSPAADVDRAVTTDADQAAPPSPAPSAGAVLSSYTITKEDTAGPFVKMPRARDAEELMQKKAKLPRLGYTSSLERLGEKFHINPKVLVQLNPRKNFSRVGEDILVPNLPAPTVEKANLIVVDASDHGVTALSADGRILAFYPATMGSEHDPLPLGNWKINGVSLLPKFHYDPRLFWDAKNKNAKAVLPPGHNSPVGTVWIDLSKEHYGIHGTPEPSLIGKSESHGCIRLTNWDVEELAKMVGPGLPVVLQE